jgi:hypothetical protein
MSLLFVRVCIALLALSSGGPTSEPEILVRSQADGTITHLGLARLRPEPQGTERSDVFHEAVHR